MFRAYNEYGRRIKKKASVDIVVRLKKDRHLFS
nr:MAG TPA: hypothetical protein [Caudoviricetes sp.]